MSNIRLYRLNNFYYFGVEINGKIFLISSIGEKAFIIAPPRFNGT